MTNLNDALRTTGQVLRPEGHAAALPALAVHPLLNVRSMDRLLCAPVDALVSQAEKRLVIAEGRIVVENHRTTLWRD